MESLTISALAEEAASWFEVATRDDGERYSRSEDNAPEWVTDLAREAHGGMLPDDWRYEAIQSALEFIGALGHTTRHEVMDASYEFADGMVNAYTGARIKWLASSLERVGYCDQAVEDGVVGDDAGIADRIGIGQFREAEEVYGLVVQALDERLDDLDAA